MLARNETIFKWFLYSAAAVLCLTVQGAVLQRFTLWGVIPFVCPLLSSIPATWESPAAGTVFSLAVGVTCDLLLPACGAGARPPGRPGPLWPCGSSASPCPGAFP